MTDVVPVQAVRTDRAKVGVKVVAKIGGNEVAAKYGVKAYSVLMDLKVGTGLVAHHLIEKRFAPILGVDQSKMLSIVLTKAEHQAFTNKWRQAISYGAGTGSATKAKILAEARGIYAEYPEILKALGLTK